MELNRTKDMTSRLELINPGCGVGLRDIHFPYLMANPPSLWNVDWFEIITENFLDNDGYAMHVLDHVRRHRPIVMHGVSLSIGGPDPLDKSYLTKVLDLAARINPLWISDHLCWTGMDGWNSHDLLPLPLNRPILDHCISRVRMVQDLLGRPLIIENPSTYLEYKSSDMPEWEFLNELAQATGCGLLLDVNNVHVSCFNHGLDPFLYLDRIDPQAVMQIHLAGPSDYGTHLIDTHDHPVPDIVWQLYAYALSRLGAIATLLEWDAEIPSFPDLTRELDKARVHYQAALAVPRHNG